VLRYERFIDQRHKTHGKHEELPAADSADFDSDDHLYQGCQLSDYVPGDDWYYLCHQHPEL
jgi:hypothetical protein